MVNKKDIGEVFSDGLQDFEQAPPNANEIWDRITTELDIVQDNDKAPPFWWRAAGLSILAIGIVGTLVYFGTDWFNNESTTDQPQFTTTSTDTTPNTDAASDNELVNTSIDLSKQEESLTEENNIVASDNSDQPTNEDSNTEAVNNSEVTTAVTSNSIKNESVTTNVTTNLNDSQNKKSNVQSATVVTNDGLDKNLNDSKNPTNNTITTTQNSSVQTATTVSNNNAVTAQQQNANNSNLSSTGVYKNYPARGYYVINKSTIKKQGVTATLFTVETKPNSGALAKPLPVLALTYDNLPKVKKSKAMRALEREIKTREALDYKWTIGPVIAPTTYGSVTRGSMLDARLVDNPRQGETNLSYGIKIKNQFTPKSALRFGVNKINLGYNTQNFQVNVIDDIVNIYQLTGIDPGQEISDGIPLNAEATQFFETNDVVGLDQQISYIEFPLEYEYAVINKRFGANLIGGSSLIVLSDNRIFASSGEGDNLEVGSANNLTGLGYTLNVGLGLDYEITKNIQFNIDPIFKLQLNGPTSTSTNNFRPYYFGIYSGLSFKF